MIALDTNILIYAFRADSPHHVRAARALHEVVDSRRVGVPWPCVHEFISVTTNPRMPHPADVPAALAAMQTLLAAPRVDVLPETEGHLDRLSSLLESSGARGPRVHDARIAAICLDHDVDELWTADRDFSLFPALRTHNPLVG